jgi:hypothetical protein
MIGHTPAPEIVTCAVYVGERPSVVAVESLDAHVGLPVLNDLTEPSRGAAMPTADVDLSVDGNHPDR